jgi:hypothetical protein
VDVDAEYRTLVKVAGESILNSCSGSRNPSIPGAFSPRLRNGGDDGKRNFALAAGRADTGDHSIVVVLRPVTARIVEVIGLRAVFGEARFCLKFDIKPALFC